MPKRGVGEGQGPTLHEGEQDLGGRGEGGGQESWELVNKNLSLSLSGGQPQASSFI